MRAIESRPGGRPSVLWRSRWTSSVQVLRTLFQNCPKSLSNQNEVAFIPQLVIGSRSPRLFTPMIVHLVPSYQNTGPPLAPPFALQGL